jgi:hypothetical protein
MCVAGFIPLAFATAFLVPGVLLHVRLFLAALE